MCLLELVNGVDVVSNRRDVLMNATDHPENQPTLPFQSQMGVQDILQVWDGEALERVDLAAVVIKVGVAVNAVGNARTSCGEDCTVYGPSTPTPVMTWIHPGAHVYPRGTTERIVSFFRDNSRAH